jgi:hypothetical protein
MPCITTEDFEAVFGEKLSPRIAAKVRASDLRYDHLTAGERDVYLLAVLDELTSTTVKAAGEHRQADWEKGWGENLKQFAETGDIGALVPKYHRKRQVVHWRQDVVRAAAPDFDLAVHEILVDYVFEKYLADRPTVLEFGCGPAYHLLRLRRLNPKARLVGLDWARASTEIISRVRELGIDSNIDGHAFNFFQPDYGIDVPEGSGVYTIAALEQVGDRHEPFIQFLLSKRPAICVHLEPIAELLDTGNLIDRASQLYFAKRNYLRGFLARLRQLSDEGRVTLHREQRTYTGSYFIEGHSLVVWSPNP